MRSRMRSIVNKCMLAVCYVFKLMFVKLNIDFFFFYIFQKTFTNLISYMFSPFYFLPSPFMNNDSRKNGCSFLRIYTIGQKMVVHFHKFIQLARILFMFTSLYSWPFYGCSYLQSYTNCCVYLDHLA